MRRKHVSHVIDALVAEFDRVLVEQYGKLTTTCVEQCWNARSETIADCECAGSNHGSGQATGKEPTIGLSVQHEFTKAVYVVTTNGWGRQLQHPGSNHLVLGILLGIAARIPCLRNPLPQVLLHRL